MDDKAAKLVKLNKDFARQSLLSKLYLCFSRKNDANMRNSLIRKTIKQNQVMPHSVVK